MNKIYKILAISSMLVLVSACQNSGSTLDKKNISSADKTVTNNVSSNVGHVTSGTVATSNAVTEAAKSLPK